MLLERLAAHVSLVQFVPCDDSRFVHPPAKEDDALLAFTGEIHEANREVFHLDTECLDGGDLGIEIMHEDMQFLFQVLCPLRVAIGMGLSANGSEFLLYRIEAPFHGCKMPEAGAQHGQERRRFFMGKEARKTGSLRSLRHATPPEWRERSTDPPHRQTKRQASS